MKTNQLGQDLLWSNTNKQTNKQTMVCSVDTIENY